MEEVYTLEVLLQYLWKGSPFQRLRYRNIFFAIIPFLLQEIVLIAYYQSL